METCEGNIVNDAIHGIFLTTFPNGDKYGCQ